MMITVTEEDACNAKRLDVFLSEKCGVTRSRAQKLIADGKSVLVNGETKQKNYQILSGDCICFEEPAPVPAQAEPEDIPIEIIYEDDFIAVVNKPKGMVVHPAAGNYTGTLVSALLYRMQGRLSGINGVIRPGIVHRIDKDTSGLLIIAKTDAAHTVLAEQIKKHDFLREYEAVVIGNIKEDHGTIEKPIGRNPKDRKKMAVTNVHAREARTDYEVLERFDGFTWMRFRLYTGRTHQIRVHLSSIGHPLAGDTVYGGGRTKFERQNEQLLQGQCLHAKTIGFHHPVTGEYLVFDAGLPDYFEEILKKLRGKSSPV